MNLKFLRKLMKLAGALGLVLAASLAISAILYGRSAPTPAAEFFAQVLYLYFTAAFSGYILLGIGILLPDRWENLKNKVPIRIVGIVSFLVGAFLWYGLIPALAYGIVMMDQ